MRSIGTAYLLCIFLGWIGAHRFYCGRVATGIIWFLTAGLMGIGWIIDLFLIPDMVDEANREYLSYQRNFDPENARQNPSLVDDPPIASATAHRTPADQSTSCVADPYRVVFCTSCGEAMRVPSGSAGSTFACPNCRTVLRVPA